MLLLEGISFGYGRSRIIHDLTLSVKKGELVGLVGPNGAGKSTLLKLAAGIACPEQGSVLINDTPVRSLSRLEAARTVALVPQNPQFSLEYSIRDVVLMGRHPHLPAFADYPSGDRRLVDQIISELQIASLSDESITRVSAGERQRAVIARALAQQPQLLLLDEPTAHLDVAHQLLVLSILRRLARDGGTAILMSSHDLNLTGLWVDRIVLLDRGRVAADGPPAEVMTEGTLQQVYRTPVLVIKHPQTHRPQIVLPGPAD